MNVTVTTFEIIGEGRDLADDFETQKQSAKKAHWSFVNEVGGAGYCPDSWTGGVRSVLFDREIPKGWRKIGMHKGFVNAVPNKATKLGKALIANMAELLKKPLPTRLAADLGYDPNVFAMDGTTIYFPTEIRVAHPEKRHFLRLPLTPADGFEPDPDLLKAVPESELMKAVEDHNAEASRLREAEAQA